MESRGGARHPQPGGMMTKARPTIADQLRQAIQASGQSQYALAKAVGVHQSVISRFLAGQRDVTLATAAKLAEHLGLELRPKG
jgi:plasmid maintenance system antidote protein VapI